MATKTHSHLGVEFVNFLMLALKLTQLLCESYRTRLLGAGFVVLDEGEPLLSFLVLNPTDTTRTSGINELFNEGVAMGSERRLPAQFFGLPGHQLFGGTCNNRTYTSLGQDPRIILPNVPVARKDGSWSLYWNCDQYLVVDPKNAKRG